MTRFCSGPERTAIPRRLRLRLRDLLLARWRFAARVASTLPDAVTLQRFVDDLCVFFFGILMTPFAAEGRFQTTRLNYYWAPLNAQPPDLGLRNTSPRPFFHCSLPKRTEYGVRQTLFNTRPAAGKSKFRHRRETGGADEIRTHDPYVANVMLYQLSYRPSASDVQKRTTSYHSPNPNSR